MPETTTMEAIFVEVGCPKCGAEEHTVTVDFAACSDGPKLDIVLKCEECGHKLNGFMAIDDMMELPA